MTHLITVFLTLIHSFFAFSTPVQDNIELKAPQVKMAGVMRNGTVIYLFKEGELSLTERRSEKYLEKENPTLLKALIKSYDNDREWVSLNDHLPED